MVISDGGTEGTDAVIRDDHIMYSSGMQTFGKSTNTRLLSISVEFSYCLDIINSLIISHETFSLSVSSNIAMTNTVTIITAVTMT